MSKFRWDEYRREREQQQRQQGQQQRQQWLDDAAERLHELCVELLDVAGELGLTEAELAELLDVEREWFAGDVVYQALLLDQS